MNGSTGKAGRVRMGAALVVLVLVAAVAYRTTREGDGRARTAPATTGVAAPATGSIAARSHSDAVPQASTTPSRLTHSLSGAGTATVGEIVHLLPHFMPRSAQDGIAEYRIAWATGDGDSVVAAGAKTYAPETLPTGSTIFRLRHQYADTGRMEIRFTIVTRDGEQLTIRDTVRVVPGPPPRF